MSLNDIKGLRESAGPVFDEIVLNNVWNKSHGIESCGTLSFDNSTHILTIAAATNAYWFDGVRYVTTSAITKDIDDNYTIATDTLYYFYFDDASGTLKVSTGVWNLQTTVPVATVFWNGSAGALVKETHGYKRNLDWHVWAHLTVGARIASADFGLTAPNSGSPTTVAVAGGTLYDEDLASTFEALTNCRVWYQTSATKYRWVDSNSVYPTNVRFSDSANSYTLTDVSNAQYINIWVYASPDIARPIYCFVETKATSGYTTVANARAATPPNLSNFGLTPELKLLYRIIMKGDETYSEKTDYRSSASLPAGGASSPTAASVTFSPSGGVAATSVQTAIEELDAEKAPLASPTFTGTVTLPSRNVLPTDGQVKLTRPSTDGHATGNVTDEFNSGYSSSAIGDLVYLDSSSTWQKADMDTSAATYSGLLGIALEVKASGNALKVALPGSFVYCTAFPTLTIGSPVYMSDAGAIIVAQPSGADDAIRMIGWAIHADKIFFFPSPDYIVHT